MLHVCFHLEFSSASTIFLLVSLLLFPSPSPCPLKFLSFTSASLFTLVLWPCIFKKIFFLLELKHPLGLHGSGCFAAIWSCSAHLASPSVLMASKRGCIWPMHQYGRKHQLPTWGVVTNKKCGYSFKSIHLFTPFFATEVLRQRAHSPLSQRVWKVL